MQSEPLIESVRALASQQKKIGFTRLDGVSVDFPALLAALERAERIHQDAVAINAGYKNGIYEIAASDKEQHEMAEAFFADLDAALKEIQ